MRLPLAFDFQRLFGNVVDFLHHLDGKGTGVIPGVTPKPGGDLRQHHTARSAGIILHLTGTSGSRTEGSGPPYGIHFIGGLREERD